MTKIAFCSDLHCDFTEGDIFSDNFLYNKDNSDVLCLLGDTFEIRNHDKFKDVFYTLAECYPIILFIYGNHCFYNNDILNAKKQMQEFTKDYPNFHILDNDIFELDNLVFVGTTLWTDMNNFNPDVCSAAGYLMNDYRLIRSNAIPDLTTTDWYCNLKVEETLGYHLKAVDFIDKQCKLYKDKSIVVLSHHAPHPKSTDRDIDDLQGAYCSDLSDIIIDNENLILFLHGHCHQEVSYDIEQCTIMSHPRGYPNQLFCKEEYDNFKPKLIEILL